MGSMQSELGKQLFPRQSGFFMDALKKSMKRKQPPEDEQNRYENRKYLVIDSTLRADLADLRVRTTIFSDKECIYYVPSK
jgi:hypothetical protein